ncbi:MAG: type I restriction-modification system DNA methylase subunit [Candidatus Deianiraeaceae bacterium]|jgi:type I restriction-modification system DNA methylase subunit
MNTKDLQKKWNTEKEHYKQKEVGDGVEAFVIDVLQSEVFNLTKGLGSQTNANRVNEFTLEHSKKGDDKKTRRADVVVFVNSNVVIPIEVERFENIKEGEKQIIAYQRDWEKKYGILTDGYTWRFYNNTKYQTFTIDSLLENTKEFQSFWSDYTKEDRYYLDFLKPQNESLFKEFELIRVDDNSELFFKDTTALIERFINKLNLAEFYKDKKTQTELAYSYLIQFVLVKSLVDNGYEQFVNDYNNKLQSIISNLEKSNYSKILATIRNLSSAIEKDLYKPFKEDQKFINQKLDNLLKQDNEEIGDISIWLDIVCYIHKFNFGGITNDIFGSIYENYLKELYSEENLGQFFTPPEVVDFMLDEIGWTEENMQELAKNDKLSIVDPSCGSGTFLYSATNILMNAIPHDTEEKSKEMEKLVNNNIFGLDVEEFSLYLAEMSMLMRLLPCIFNEKYNNPIDKKLKIFKTKDSIAEFLNNDLEDKNLGLFDTQLDLGYHSFLRDEDDLKEMKTSMQPPRTRFDFVVGNPPYIGYNECSARKLLFITMCRDKKFGISMNDIYGVNMNTVPNRHKKYSPKPNLYTFFMALGSGLLKEGGKMSYIIPQTLLTSNDLDVMRYHLAKNMTIEKIITFSCKMFVNRGIGKKRRSIATSSLIFVVKKAEPKPTHKVEIVHYENAEAGVTESLKDIKKGKNTLKKSILQTELLENVDNWNYIKQRKEFLKFYEFYKKHQTLSDYRSQLDRIKSDIYFDGGVNIDDNLIGTNSKNAFEIFNHKANDWSKFTPIKSDTFYPKDSKIDFIAGSQGIQTFLNKYKIIWRTEFKNKFQYTDRDLLLINNQSLIISSNSKENILYFLSLFNNPILLKIFEANLKNKNERRYLLPLRPIKSFIRIPIVTENNKHIKAKVIEETEKMLALETKTLKDLVDFKYRGMCPQKFEKVEVKNGFLACDNIKFEILEQEAFIEKLITEQNKEILNEAISLQSLKDLEAIDFDLRDSMKQYIDHLVFALYCDVELQEIEFKDFNAIKQECEKNEFYEVVFKVE